MKINTSSREIIELLANSEEPLTDYKISTRTKYAQSTVHEAIKTGGGLEDTYRVRPVKIEKWKTRKEAVYYTLSFKGFIEYFDSLRQTDLYDNKKLVEIEKSMTICGKMHDYLILAKIHDLFEACGPDIFPLVIFVAHAVVQSPPVVKHNFYALKDRRDLKEDDFEDRTITLKAIEEGWKNKFSGVFLEVFPSFCRDKVDLKLPPDLLANLKSINSELLKNNQKAIERLNQNSQWLESIESQIS